jgi:hypothetical protein
MINYCVVQNTECVTLIQNAKTLIHKEVTKKTGRMKNWKYRKIEPGLSSL